MVSLDLFLLMEIIIINQVDSDRLIQLRIIINNRLVASKVAMDRLFRIIIKIISLDLPSNLLG